MQRELMLLRHGEAGWSNGEDDFDRSLTTIGQQSAAAVGRALRQYNRTPDHIIASPARRAMMTAQSVAQALDLPKLSIHRAGRIYDAPSVDRLLAVLAELPEEAERVLLIGHNPGLTQLLVYLIGDTSQIDSDLPLPTAGLARLTIGEEWPLLNQRCATLNELLLP